MTAAHQVLLSPPTSPCIDNSGRQQGPPPVIESSASPSVVNATTGELFPAGLGIIALRIALCPFNIRYPHQTAAR